MNVDHGKCRRMLIGLYCSASAFFLVGCVTVHEEKMEGLSVRTIFHYGRGMGVSDMYVNGMWAGGHIGWGGGGSTYCCVEISRDRTKPVIIKVKWESCDIRHIEYKNDKRVDPDATCIRKWHESDVPINFSEKSPGHHFGLVIHVLPGHRIEAWTADKGILENDYPGPPFPRGKAPQYQSISEE